MIEVEEGEVVSIRSWAHVEPSDLVYIIYLLNDMFLSSVHSGVEIQR